MTHKKPEVWAIVPAGGSGLRMGTETKKQYLKIGAKSILLRTIEMLSGHPSIDKIVLAVPANDIEKVSKYIRKSSSATKVVAIVPGGATRQESVANGFKVIGESCGIVLVHDAVRPFVPQTLIDDLLESAIKNGAAVPVLPVSETLRHADNGLLADDMDRTGAVLVQTPQVFGYDLLKKAIESAIISGFAGTDESSIVRRIGHDVACVEGSRMNIKITTRDDLDFAEKLNLF